MKIISIVEAKNTDHITKQSTADKGKINNKSRRKKKGAYVQEKLVQVYSRSIKSIV